MKGIARQALLLLSVFLYLAYWMESSPMAQSGEKTMDASKLFNDNCAKCHGRDGHAKTFRGKLVGARNLTDAKWKASATDERIIAAIKKGPGAMPAFEKKFTQEQIESLVAYVRHFKQEETKPDNK